MGKNKKEVSNIIYENLENSHLLGRTLARKCVNSDWGTVGFDMTKDDIQINFVDSELRFNCIYFLFVMDKTSRTPETVYVGQAATRNDGTSILSRLREHINSTTEDFVDQWSFAAVFTNKNDTWDSAVLDALESIFYDDIPANLRLNKKKCAYVKDRSIYEDKVDQIKKYLAFMGYSIFSSFAEDTDIQIQDKVVIFDDDNKPIEDLQKKMSRIPEYITPIRTVKDMVDMLFKELYKCGKDLWTIKFLDPACKGGEFLREVYDRLMNDDTMIAKFPDYAERSIHILSNQLFGIALSQVSKDRATKKLFGYGHNIKIVNNYIKLLKGMRYGNNMQEIINREFNKNMEIDVVIGNPPYQEESRSIYDLFIDMGISIGKTVCMITKNNWMESDTLKKTRDNMIKAGLVFVYNYPELGDVFKGVSVQVAIFQIQKGYKGNTEFKEIRHGSVVSSYSDVINEGETIYNNKLAHDIYKKVKPFISGDGFGDLTYPAECFRVNSNGTVGRGDSTYVLMDRDEPDKEYNVAVVYLDSSKIPYIRWIKKEDVPSREHLVGKYKVICGCVLTNDSSVLRSVKVLNPNTIISKSWGLLHTCDTAEEAHNVEKYVQTKFVRYLINIHCSNGMNCMSAYRFSAVPVQDFSSNLDVDWTQSIQDIDKQLYKKYDLTQEEIDYIENTIKPMN